MSLGSTSTNTAAASPATTASPATKTPDPSFSATIDFIHFQFFVVSIEESQKVCWFASIQL